MSFEFTGDPYAAQLRAAKAEGELARIKDALREFAEDNGLNPEMEPRDLLAKAAGAFRSCAAMSDARYAEIRRLKEEIEAMRPRLMPEGMEWLVEAWPRFEDDAPVKFGDMALIDGEADMVEAVQLWIHGKPVIYGDGGSQQLERGECVKRPAPKVLDADGVEIRVGDRLYDTDTGCGRTVRSINANGTVEFEGCEDRGWFTRFLTHRAPVIAADGKPLEAGQTVWTVDAGIKFEVHSIEGDTVWGSLDGDCADDGLDPKSLTHERPVADTWERIEEDAEGGAKGYCYERGIAVDGGAYGQAKAVDLVRRAKKLAERGV